MNIYENHPDYLEFIKNEKKTLSFLYRNSFLREPFPDLVMKAEYSFYDLPKDDRLLTTKDFAFESCLDLVVEGKYRRIIVEANIKSKFSLASYALSICELNEDPFNLIRKFHFDFARPLPNDPNPKPVYHLQYGGKQSPGLSALNIKVDDLYPWLSSPRLYHIPTNLALILDMLFCEFRNEVTEKISQRSEWRDFIKYNETYLLKDYYSQARSFMDNHHTSNFLFREYCYGKS